MGVSIKIAELLAVIFGLWMVEYICFAAVVGRTRWNLAWWLTAYSWTFSLWLNTRLVRAGISSGAARLKILAIIHIGFLTLGLVLKLISRHGGRPLAAYFDLFDGLFERYIVAAHIYVSRLLSEKLGIGTPLYLDLLATKAGLFQRRGGFSKAEESTDRAYNAWLKSKRRSSLWSLSFVHGLGNFYASTGRLSDAERVLREGITAFQADPSEWSIVAYGELLSSLGQVYLAKGALADAEHYCRLGFVTLKQHLGFKRTETLQALVILQNCIAQKEDRQLEEADLDYLFESFKNPLVLRRYHRWPLGAVAQLYVIV